ncbi:MAG: DEAD/DEAH box helicase [Alphaproteobacteria bacterium]|nr:MAG: DEAD/DEAH box helicase [Alphaproteobacteria bacterium]
MLLTPIKDIALRPYQADAIEAMRQRIRVGEKRLILCAGTGAGKTVMAAHLLQQAANKGRYALFIVDRVALVDQASAVFDEYGIAHGVVQGNNPRWMPREHVQVCSAQSLARRILPREPELIIVDEAHCNYKGTNDLMAAHPQAVKIGLTATPFTKGMGKIWDHIVNVIPTRRLIEQGYLIEPTIYVARSPEDDELELNSYGEFSEDSATEAGIRIVGDVVSEWVAKTNKHFGGPVKTIVFAATVKHGRALCEAFGAAGYNFQQISYLDRDDSERAAKIAEFRRPDSEIDGLVSCGVLTKGFDVPDVMCGISSRPYRKSLSSHMQEVGRVMRVAPGKTMALWLDHSGNIERFASDMFDVWENGPGPLDKAETRDRTPRNREKTEREKIVCPECSGCMHGLVCLACGWERPARSDVVEVPGELLEFKRPKMIARDGLRAECLKEPRIVWDAALHYVFDRTRLNDASARKYAYKIFRTIYPQGKVPNGWYNAPPRLMPDSSALSLIQREASRIAKSRARAAS